MIMQTTVAHRPILWYCYPPLRSSCTEGGPTALMHKKGLKCLYIYIYITILEDIVNNRFEVLFIYRLFYINTVDRTMMEASLT